MTSPTQRVSLPDSRIQHDEHIAMSRSPKNDAENTDSWPTADQTSKANSEDSSSTVISFDNVRQPLKRKRRVLTETERQEAAVMRRLGSCDACKRRKVRCDPSHVRNNDPRLLPGVSSEEHRKSRPEASDPNFQFEFPKFGRLPGLSSISTLSKSGQQSDSSTDHKLARRPSLQESRLCPHCDVECANPGEYQRHLKTHTGELDVGGTITQPREVNRTGHKIPSSTPGFTAVNRSPFDINDLAQKEHQSQSRALYTPMQPDQHGQSKLEDFAKDMQKAADVTFPRNSPSRYSSVHVLLLRWEADESDLPMSELADDLATAFSEVYNFKSSIALIPNTSPSRWLMRRVLDFIDVDEDSSKTLKILWYGGHSLANETGTECLWSNGLEGALSASVSSQGPLVLLQEAQSDVLLLLDTNCAGLSSTSGKGGVTEVIAAGVLNADPVQRTLSSGFTQSLIAELRAGSTTPSISVPHLHARLFSRMRCRTPEQYQWSAAPIYLALGAPARFPRSIELSPMPMMSRDEFIDLQELRKETGTTTSAKSPKPNATLTFSVELTHTKQSSVEQLSEWLQTIPLSVRRVQVDADYAPR